MRLAAAIFLGLSAAVLVSGGVGAGSPVFLAHAVFAAAALPLMMAAMLHFVPVLTRSGGPSTGMTLIPWFGWLAGVVVLAVFGGVWPRHMLWVAAAIDAALAFVLAAWIIQRCRKTLGRPHPGAWWYVAALGILIVGLVAAAAMLAGDNAYGAWRRLHVHGNLFGWIGLTALGTLAVLLPTAMGKPEPTASARLAGDLPWASAGVIALAAGAAVGVAWLSIVGALALSAVILRQSRAWLNAYGGRAVLSGVAGSLAMATGFLLALVVVGIAHSVRLIDSAPPAMAFIQGFLLPLVSGALAQLLPVWCFPGVATPAREQYRHALARHATPRGVAFVLAGVLQALGGTPARLADGLAALTLLSLALIATRGLPRPSPQPGE